MKLIKYFQQNALRYHKTSNQLYTTFLLKFLCKNERAEGKTFRTSIEHLSCDSFLMPDFVKNKNDIARLSSNDKKLEKIHIFLKNWLYLRHD